MVFPSDLFDLSLAFDDDLDDGLWSSFDFKLDLLPDFLLVLELLLDKIPESGLVVVFFRCASLSVQAELNTNNKLLIINETRRVFKKTGDL